MIIQQWHKIRIKNKQFYVNQLCDFYYILYEINFSIISNNDFLKGIRKTSILYSVCFGLKITLMSDIYLELQDSKKFKICFYRVNNFAQQTKGYCPILTFNVSEFDETLQKVIHYVAQQEHNFQEQENQKLFCKELMVK